VAFVILLSLINAIVSCWFTKLAMELKYGLLRTTSYESFWFLVRFLGCGLLVNVIFLSVGLVIVFALSPLIYPVSPIAEKATIGFAFVVFIPAFVALMALTLFWSFWRHAYRSVLGEIASAVAAYGWRAYKFFGLIMIIRLAANVSALTVLRVPIQYWVRIAVVIVIMTAVTMLVRGLRFEFVAAETLRPQERAEIRSSTGDDVVERRP
jgi:hypothetical protein